MMLTIDQIRAARALLDWSQQDLAEHADLSQTGIARIENKTNKPNSKTLQKIESAFDRANIEFIGNSGLRRRRDQMKTLRGTEGFEVFMRDVYETIQTSEKTTCLSNVDERFFNEKFEEMEFPYIEKMEKLYKEQKFKFRILVKKGDHFSIADYAEYRETDPKFFGSTPFYVYGNKLAIILFEGSGTVHIINNEEIADAQRKQFSMSWETAEEA